MTFVFYGLLDEKYKKGHLFYKVCTLLPTTSSIFLTMKCTQLAVIIFVVIQQSLCIIEEDYQKPLLFKDASLKMMEKEENILHELESNQIQRSFSTLYNDNKGHCPNHKKMKKVMEINLYLNDNKEQENILEKRQNKPKLTRSASAPASITHEASSAVTKAKPTKIGFRLGKGGKIAAGAVLATAATGAIISGGVAIHHRMKKQQQQQDQESQMVKRQNVVFYPKHKKMARIIEMNDNMIDDIKVQIDENEEVQLQKRGKGKMALLFGGGAVVGALGMKHFSNKSGGGAPPADPNAGGAPAK